MAARQARAELSNQSPTTTSSLGLRVAPTVATGGPAFPRGWTSDARDGLIQPSNWNQLSDWNPPSNSNPTEQLHGHVN